MTAGVPCTCRSSQYDVFPEPCAARYHHWQAIMETMSAPGARIEWNEDYVTEKDDVCLCKACRPVARPVRDASRAADCTKKEAA